MHPSPPLQANSASCPRMHELLQRCHARRSTLSAAGPEGKRPLDCGLPSAAHAYIHALHQLTRAAYHAHGFHVRASIQQSLQEPGVALLSRAVQHSPPVLHNPPAHSNRTKPGVCEDVTCLWLVACCRPAERCGMHAGLHGLRRASTSSRLVRCPPPPSPFSPCGHTPLASPSSGQTCVKANEVHD